MPCNAMHDGPGGGRARDNPGSMSVLTPVVTTLRSYSKLPGRVPTCLYYEARMYFPFAVLVPALLVHWAQVPHLSRWGTGTWE